MNRALFACELKRLLRDWGVRAALMIYVVLSVAALGQAMWASKHDQADQTALMQEFASQTAHWKEQLADTDTPAYTAGYAAYYVNMPTAQARSGWSFLFPGRWQEHNHRLRIRLLALQPQLSDAPLRNHQHAPIGMLSLEFIWVYLLPLLIGLLCVNVMADDRAQERWSMLSALASSGTALIKQRLLVHLVVVFVLHVLVLVVATLLLPLDAYAWVMVLVSLLVYQLFWFALCALIISFNQDRRKNLIWFCGLWMVLSMLLPGLVHLQRMQADELPVAIEAFVDQRESITSSWEIPKQEAMDAFLTRYPEWKNTAPLGEAFDWKFYYAMQRTSDEHVADLAKQYRNMRLAKHQQAVGWSWLSPVTAMQLSFRRVANTDTKAYQQYHDQLRSHHRQAENFYFPYLFLSDRIMKPADFDALPAFSFASSPQAKTTSLLGWVHLLPVLLVLMVVVAWRHRTGPHLP